MGLSLRDLVKNAYYYDKTGMLLQGDCIEWLKQIPNNTIDSIVTDPPYNLSFMSKKWDGTGIAFKTEVWKECLRVLKPGGHLLAFGGTRTYHRMACAIEDSGFEIRDEISYFYDLNDDLYNFVSSLNQQQQEAFLRLYEQSGFGGSLNWIYGSGFPKSMNISKKIDKKIGVERKIVGKYQLPNGQKWNLKQAEKNIQSAPGWFTASGKRTLDITAPATPEAQQWDGWGTALKPAHEPIIVARKPLGEKTVTNNVLKWGTGGINIDDCRIELQEEGEDKRLGGKGTWKTEKMAKNVYKGGYSGEGVTSSKLGRFPANVILDEKAGKLLDEQSGILKSGALKPYQENHQNASSYKMNRYKTFVQPANEGGASRFFYCAKASKKERGEGNNHPTVKPLSLIEYLVTLVTPPEGIVLDLFGGSGTTALACKNKRFKWILIEKEKEYCELSVNRIKSHKTKV